MPTKLDQDNQIQEDYDHKFNDQAAKLNDAERGGSQARVDSEFDQIAAANRDIDSRSGVEGREKSGSTSDTIPVDLTPGKGAKQKISARTFFRKYGAIGAATGGITAFILTVLTTSAPLAIMTNFKSVAVRNFDLQNITAEPRARLHLKNRFSGPVNNLCNTLPAACKYSRPSKKLMTELDKAGIRYLDADGNPMEQERVVNGERPVYYETPEGTRIESVNFNSELRNNVEFRTAFRRGYNPRWVNWTNDKTAIFAGRYGWTKDNPDKMKNADSPDDSAKEIEKKLNPEAAADAEARANGDAPEQRPDKDNPANRQRLEADMNRELQSYASKQGRRVGRVADNLFIPAVMGCAMTGVPGVISNVARAYRIAKAASVIMMFLTAADEITAREATPKHISAMAGNLTETGTDPATGIPGKSAMDAGAMLYLLFGDVGSAKLSTHAKEMMPGRTIGSLAQMAGIANSPAIKGGCDAITSNQAGVAMGAVDAIRAFRATNPVGLALAGLDIAVSIANEAGWLDDFYAYIIGEGLQALMAVIDWESLAETAFGDYAESVRYEALGDLIGVNTTQIFGLKANFEGDVPQTPEQAVETQERIAMPLAAQWAEEDRLTHSPFDASNPHTFLGSITTQMIPYLSSFSSISSGLSSIMSISSKSLVASVATPSANASAVVKGIDDVKACEGDYAVETSGVAAGPLCNVFYGVPAEYLGIDPIKVIKDLHDLKQIDDELEIVDGSDLEEWKADCNNGDMMSLGACTISRAVDGEGLAYLKALYTLYIKDDGIIHDMDDEDLGVPDPEDVDAAAPGATGAAFAGELAWPMEKALFDANQGDWLDPHSANSGTWTSGTRSLAVDIGGRGTGTPVFAMLGGTVSRASLGGHGLEITSQVEGGTLEIAYAHGPRTNQNATYQAGDQIMTVACLGNCFGPHLHIDMAFNGRGVCPQDVFIAMRDNAPVNFAELANRASAPCAGRLGTTRNT